MCVCVCMCVCKSLSHIWLFVTPWTMEFSRPKNTATKHTLKNWCFWNVVLEDSWESLGLQGDATSPSSRKSVLNIHWKDWCWSWNSNTLATWCKELTWLWERLKVGREGDDRGWDGWMASPTRWTWVWVSSRSWWWTEKPGMLQSMGLQRVGHNWETELNWTETHSKNLIQLAYDRNISHVLSPS